MNNREKIILGVTLAFVFGVVAASIFGTILSLSQTDSTISNTGSVKGVGVEIYWDSACTNKTLSINWGLMDPGLSKTVTVYVKNEGNVAVTLSKTTQNWNPSTASSYFTLNWNYNSQTLSVNQLVQIQLTLVVSSTISEISSFSFDITIFATG